MLPSQLTVLNYLDMGVLMAMVPECPGRQQLNNSFFEKQ